MPRPFTQETYEYLNQFREVPVSEALTEIVDYVGRIMAEHKLEVRVANPNRARMDDWNQFRINIETTPDGNVWGFWEG